MIDWKRVASYVATADGPVVKYGDGQLAGVPDGTVGQVYRAVQPLLPPLTSQGALIQFPQPGYRAMQPTPPPVYIFLSLVSGVVKGTETVQQYWSCQQIKDHANALFYAANPNKPPYNQAQVVVGTITFNCPPPPPPAPPGGTAIPSPCLILATTIGTYGLDEATGKNPNWLKCPAGT